MKMMAHSDKVGMVVASPSTPTPPGSAICPLIVRSLSPNAPSVNVRVTVFPLITVLGYTYQWSTSPALSLPYFQYRAPAGSGSEKVMVTSVLVPEVPVSRFKVRIPLGKVTPVGGVAGGIPKDALATRHAVVPLLLKVSPTRAVPEPAVLLGALHDAVVPPPLPAQLQVHGLADATLVKAPALQRFAVGFKAEATPFALPQAPFTVPGVGITEFDAADADPVPTAFVAVTVKV
jgi:hypothetical protein